MPAPSRQRAFRALFFFFLPSLSRRRFMVIVRLHGEAVADQFGGEHRTAASERLIVLHAALGSIRVDGVRRRECCASTA